MNARIVCAALAACMWVGPLVAGAEGETGLALSKACTIVDTHDVAQILGVAVQTPEPQTKTAGICTFASQSASDEGIATYAVVTQADVGAQASYFKFLAVRRCGNVDPRAPVAAQCATYRKLGDATTVADYFAARSDVAEAVPKVGLGDAAVATATAVFVKRGGEVFECVARRDEFLDIDRSIALASLLLARVEPIAAPPVPAASKAP